MVLAPTLSLNTPARGYDADATAFAAASGATDVSNLSAFVKGVKELGLWSNMVCWPLRSTQNAGTGDTVYSLGGLGAFNGTRVNGPTWGADGITFSGGSPTESVNPAAITADKSVTLFYAASHSDLTSTEQKAINVNGAEVGRAFSATGVEAAWVASPFPTVARSTVVSGFAINTFYSAAGTFDDATTSISRFYNGGSKVTNSSADLSGTPTAEVFIGKRTGDNSKFVGTIAVATYINSVLSDAQVAALHSLYRDTLGTGLAIP